MLSLFIVLSFSGCTKEPQTIETYIVEKPIWTFGNITEVLSYDETFKCPQELSEVDFAKCSVNQYLDAKYDVNYLKGLVIKLQRYFKSEE